MGSPLYMSPEQMRSSKNVDARSDIWALGVILYELFTGRVPFEAEAIPELCLKVVQDPAEPPRSIRPEIPEGLSAVVLKCLEKDPAMRFENVADLAAALEPYTGERGSADRIAGTLKIPSRPPMVSISGIGASTNPKAGTGGTAWGTTQRVLARKRRMPLIAGGAVAAAAVIGIAMFAFGHRSGQATDEKTTAASSTAQTEATTVRAPALTAPPTTFDMPVVSASAAPVAVQQTTATRPAASGGRTTVKPAQTTSAKVTAPTVTAPPKNFE